MTHPPKEVGHIRLIEAHDGEHLIATDRKSTKVSAHLLNGSIPGFLVIKAAGLERFYPATNVMYAELAHGATADVIEQTKSADELVETLRHLQRKSGDYTAKEIAVAIKGALAEVAGWRDLTGPLPRDGQIAKDRRTLMDHCVAAERAISALDAILPEKQRKEPRPDEEKPSEDKTTPGKRGRPPKAR